MKTEVAVALANLAFFADFKQKIELLNRGMMEIWADLLSQFEAHEDRLVVRILEGLQSMLALGEEMEGSLGANAVKACAEGNAIPGSWTPCRTTPTRGSTRPRSGSWTAFGAINGCWKFGSRCLI